MTPSAVAPLPATRPGLLRVLSRRWRLGVLALAAAGFALPIGLLAHGTERARRCVARVEAPRGAALPDCKPEIRWLYLPARLPWTASAARYRAEEINMRAAVAAYDDAALGHPDAAALGPAVTALTAAAKVVAAGSQRLALEELGHAVGAPDPGRSAMLLGDRRTLLDGADHWGDWAVRLRTLEAALVEGDVPRAAAVARRYAEWDPRDEDLRTAVAAMLCLGDGGARGLTLLATVQDERSKNRHESWARNWGEVRATMVACAAKAGLTAPPSADTWTAGAGDLLEPRTALRLRVLGRHSDPTLVRDVALSAVQALQKGALPAHARVRLIAAILATGRGLSAEVAADVAAPRTAEGEPPLRPTPREMTAVAWLAQPRGLRVLAPPEALRDAAGKLRRLAADEDLPAASRPVLEEAALAAALDAARGYAAAGDAPAAVAVLDGETTLSAAERALLRSSAWYVAGDPARALAALEGEPPAAALAALRAAWLLQKGELLASNGQRDAAARAVVAADEAVISAGDRALDVRAQWTRLALARSRRSSIAARPGDPAWPWVGPQATPGSWLEPAAEGPDALARALAAWASARAASPEDRRALRYAAFRHHAGDAPGALAPYLLLGGELLPPGDGDVEVWLDAFAVTTSRGITLRAYAWARAEAARFRGDTAAAARWSERYRALVTLAAPAENAELAAALGI